MKRLADYARELALCTYCPSLCLHVCPVSTAAADDAVSPWGKMSLAEHVRRRRLDLDHELAEIFYMCLGCGACTQWCRHDVDVEGALITARRQAVASGVGPYPRELFLRPEAPLDSGPLAAARAKERYQPQPATLLFAGARVLEDTPEVVDDFLALCHRLDLDDATLGQASRLDVGYDLWAAGYERDFVAQAARVHQALAHAREVVVLSPEALYTLRDIYPRFGFPIQAELVHALVYLQPVISGASITRVSGRVAYHDSCHLARHLGTIEAPREVLGRVLAEPPVDFALSGADTVCCGATGGLPLTNPTTARAAARAVVFQALERGAQRLVSFAPEGVALLREAAGDLLQVDHAVSLLAEAVRA